MTIRLVLADDHARFRGRLARALARHGDLQVVEQAGDAIAAIAAVAACAPAAAAAGDPLLLLLDLEMPHGGGIAAARAVRAAQPEVGLLALTMHDEPAFVSALAAAGCDSVALKSDPLADLVIAIREVAAGRRYRSAGIG